MTSPVDHSIISAQMSGQDMIRKKLEMDSLRKRLGDDSSREERLREAVEGFEAIFVQKMWEQMRATVPKEGYLHGRDEEFWQGMFDKELAQKMTKAGGIGLSDMLYEQLQSKLDSASRVTTTAGAKPPVGEITSKDTVVTPKKPEEMDEIANLYAPMDDDAFVADAEATPPPAFDEHDASVFEKVDSLARDLEAQHGAATQISPAEASIAEARRQIEERGHKGGPDTHEVNGLGSPADLSRPLGAAVNPVNVAAGAKDTSEAAETVNNLDATEKVASVSTDSYVGRGPEAGMLNWPLPGRITSDFGWRNDPFTGQREWHAGVDIGGEVGDPVAAAWDGKVVFAGEKSGYGNLVVLEHAGGWKSYYAHASELSVNVGDEVKAGKKIAEVGNTGRSTGPHLHFEIRQGELAWNPQQIRSRLMAGLPVGRKG